MAGSFPALAAAGPGPHGPGRHGPGPHLTATGVPGSLRGVAVVSATNAWAVGYTAPASASIPVTLIVHWNGTSWKQVPSPDPVHTGNGSGLNDVAVVSATDIWAVGW